MRDLEAFQNDKGLIMGEAAWNGMLDSHETYQRYLASREWSLLKESVAKRSMRICERCNYHPMDHVHHLTYARKYREQLEDLQAICKGCHDFTHAKSNTDPRATLPVILGGKAIKTVYLAGKVSGTLWRDQIVDSSWSHEQGGLVNESLDKAASGNWRTVGNCIPVPNDSRRLGMTGPWWKPLDHTAGHGAVWDNTFSHANGETTPATVYGDNHGEPYIESWGHFTHDQVVRNRIINNAWTGVLKCDLFFAWINSRDCFGTLVEIGIARQAGKYVVIATPNNFDWPDMWFAIHIADRVICVDSNSVSPVKDAWSKLWSKP